MPTQEVAGRVPHSALLRGGGRCTHRVLLDGGGVSSWGNGEALYADTPVATLTVHASGWACWRSAAGERWCWGDPFAQWQAFVDGAAADGASGGVLTVLSYDLKHAVERLARRLPWPAEPLLFSARYDWSYRYDYRGDRAWIGAASTADLRARLRRYSELAPPPPPVPRLTACPRPALTRPAYVAMVEHAKDYIAAGDIYQVNLAQRFTVPWPAAAAPALYAAWVERYPTPFAAYVDGGAWVAVSNSPECFLQVDGARVATFPIKGTCRLAAGDAAAARGAALARDPKERAEHVMIVDLERNDLGRVCAIGSVEVATLGAVRAYPLLAHLESEVRGRLRPDTSLAALLRATFPGGSITGAPKIRAMQIIETLEPTARGFYTGAIGWTEPDGRSRFNIAIRTAVLAGGQLRYWAGGGIVADSDPEREYAETVLKSETLVRALRSFEGGEA